MRVWIMAMGYHRMGGVFSVDRGSLSTQRYPKGMRCSCVVNI